VSSSKSSNTPHEFHIPVLGTGFSVDTPIKVAQYGIDSVMSVVDDDLLEHVRRYHSQVEGIEYHPIEKGEEDFRARRTQAYLDLVSKLIKSRFEKVRASFPDGEEARKYFELLPSGPERDAYAKLRTLPSGAEREKIAAELKAFMRPGRADINIMTKLDRIPDYATGENPAYYSDASASLRGFAKCSLESAVVFSAGMNPRLFDYLAKFDSFRPDADGHCVKKICIKVSDYRSAFVQGVQLAKKGLWTTEFRVESGLNCGGHAFPTKGLLLGPILEEFSQRREELIDKIYAAFTTAATALGKPVPARDSLELRISAQGGVGTAEEHTYLKTRYNLSGIGWGTPFLLVPEATNVDEDSMNVLMAAKEEDIILSEASPLGVPFWIVKDCAAERLRRENIAKGKHGTSCPKGFLAFNEEFGGKPRCTAAAGYQILKLKKLSEESVLKAKDALGSLKLERMKAGVLAKACLCRDLASSFTKKVGFDPKGTTMLTAGPNLAHFSSRYTLTEFVSHIYGRMNLLADTKRPHVFIAEARIYLKHLSGELSDAAAQLSDKGKKYFKDYYENLTEGIEYYEKISSTFIEGEQERFREAVERVRIEARALMGAIDALPDTP